MKHVTHITSSLVLGKPFSTRSRFRHEHRESDADEVLPVFLDRFDALDTLVIQGLQYMTLESRSTLGSHLWESMPDVKIFAEAAQGIPRYDLEVSTAWSCGSKEKTGILCDGLCDYYLNTTVFGSPFRLEEACSYWMGIFLPLQLELQALYDGFPNPGNIATANEDVFPADRIGLMSICGVAFDISMVSDNIPGMKRSFDAERRFSALSTDSSDSGKRKRFPR